MVPLLVLELLSTFFAMMPAFSRRPSAGSGYNQNVSINIPAIVTRSASLGPGLVIVHSCVSDIIMLWDTPHCQVQSRQCEIIQTGHDVELPKEV